jgi:hypothetical protein
VSACWYDIVVVLVAVVILVVVVAVVQLNLSVAGLDFGQLHQYFE